MSSRQYIKQSAEETARSRARAGQKCREQAAQARETREAKAASEAAARAQAATTRIINELGLRRPVTRGDCIDGPRPCPWVGCRHHIHNPIKVNGQGQAAIDNQSDSLLDPDVWTDATATCALDVIDAQWGEGMHLEDIGRALGTTRERVRQIEAGALAKLMRQGITSQTLKDLLEASLEPRGIGASGSNKRAAYSGARNGG